MSGRRIISRAEAKALGLTRYFTAAPCPRGHVDERMVSSYFCVRCDNMRIRHRKQANTPRRKAKRRVSYGIWRVKNIERERQRGRVSSNNRRAKKMAVGGSHTPADVAAIFKAQNGRCAYCRVKLDRCRHVDHIVALSRGGSNDRTNLQLTCRDCNLSKNARDPIEFAQSLGMLL